MKEEVVNNLQGPQSKGVGEQDARQLLEEHIQTITATVLQEQIHARDGVSYGTNTALKSLEMQQLCSLGDLRWRIARCDASISRLSAEVKTTQESIQNLAKEQKSSNADVECKIKHIEIQISRVLGKIEQSVEQQEAKIKANQEDSSHQLHLLEAKLEGVSEDLKGQWYQFKTLEKEQERAVTECLTKIEQLSLVIKEQTITWRVITNISIDISQANDPLLPLYIIGAVVLAVLIGAIALVMRKKKANTKGTPYAVVGRNNVEGADTSEPYSVVRLAPESCSQEKGDGMNPEQAEPYSVVRLNTEYEGTALSLCEAPKPCNQQGNRDAPADHDAHIYDKIDDNQKISK
ncbi:UNVERIFIED_CONTAM: hypothetical protein FKN15_058835 [Acipenser sinensis]